jgi:UDP-N-acetylmuramoyl-tripeptide--D-alanyl-D-alanine ligase
VEPISIRDLEKIGKPEGLADNWVGTGVVIDSRQARRGDVFFCLKGAQTDGHAFVADAAARGAVCVVASSWKQNHDASFPVVAVDEPTAALQTLARNYRRKFEIPVIAVTGSNGKTTCKEMVRSALSPTFECIANPGNWNNEIGVPLTLFQISKTTQVAIIEMGADRPGDIKTLCDIAEPDSGVVTNVGVAHIEKFGSREAVAATKKELFDYLLADGVRFVNIDDPWLAPHAKTAKGCVTVSVQNAADYRGTILATDRRACVHLRIDTPETTTLEMQLHVPGAHQAMNATMAAAVAMSLGVEAARVEKALSEFTTLSDRLSMTEKNGYVVINDTYNASPESMTAALDTLARVEAKRRIAVLGDMLELGSAAEDAHAQIGKTAAGKGVTAMFLYGDLSRHVARNAGSNVEARHFSDHETLATELKRYLQPGDAVLVKGSRGMHMEKIIEAIG